MLPIVSFRGMQIQGCNLLYAGLAASPPPNPNPLSPHSSLDPVLQPTSSPPPPPPPFSLGAVFPIQNDPADNHEILFTTYFFVYSPQDC